MKRHKIDHKGAAECIDELFVAIDRNDIGMAKKFIDYTDVFHSSQISPLIRAINKERVEIVRIMLEEKANPNVREPMFDSAIEAAVRTGNIDLIRMLLDAGVKFTINPYNNSTLWSKILRIENCVEVANVLLKHGAGYLFSVEEFEHGSEWYVFSPSPKAKDCVSYINQKLGRTPWPSVVDEVPS
jgi:hypothetical protein